MDDMPDVQHANGHRPAMMPLTMTLPLRGQPGGPVSGWPQPEPEAAPEPDRGAADWRRGLRGYPWPLLVIAMPAAVAIWSGWVGLGGMCGFGPIRPLPGIADSFTINTAITLPVGVEAYGAYALAAWLGAKNITARTREWARNSAVGALVLGCLGQVAFHLLSAARWREAPWPVVTAVSCLPVVSLALAAALAHMIRADGRTAPEAAPAATEDAPEPDAGSGTEDVIDGAGERHDSDESSDAGDDETDRDERRDPDPDSDTDDDSKEPPKRPRSSAAGDKVTAALRRSKRLRDLLASDSAADRKAAKDELAAKAGVSVRSVERVLRGTPGAPP